MSVWASLRTMLGIKSDPADVPPASDPAEAAGANQETPVNSELREAMAKHAASTRLVNRSALRSRERVDSSRVLLNGVLERLQEDRIRNNGRDHLS